MERERVGQGPAAVHARMGVMRISMKFGLGLAAIVSLLACGGIAVSPAIPPSNQPFALVLGTAQDAGYPQAGCLEPC